MATNPCPRCRGCGRIASGDEGAPWSVWEDLPLKSAAAVLIGLVKPLPCPACGGTGAAPAGAPARLPEPEGATRAGGAAGQGGGA